jgi:ankyrin repeat protein/beta-lactamase regulating signal transducer with metallopeptidase domain
MIRELFLRDLSLWTCLWQSTVFISLGVIAGWFLRRRPARAYQVLLLAMVTAVAVPLLSAVVKHLDLGAFVAKPTELSYALPEMPFAMPATVPNPSAMSETAPDAGAMQPAAPKSIPAGVVEPVLFRIPWQVVLRYGWLAVTLALLGRLVATFLYGAHLVRHASRVPRDRVQRAVDSVESKLALSWALEVRASRRVHSPLVWCWSRPSILLVPDPCDDEQVDWAGVVAHELAHCKRRDHVTGLVAELAAGLLPWNPLMWLSRRMLIRLGEQACDDWVVASGQSSEDYAESLLHFRPQKQPAFWPAVVSSQGGLAHRIRRILSDACGNPRIGIRWAMTLGIAALGIGLGVAFAQTRPAFSETSTKPEKQPALSLHEAAAAGDLEQVNKLLAQGADIHAKDEDGRTPLHSAAWYGQKDVVAVLLAQGANVNEADGSGKTPLHLAANFGQKLVPELLLAQGTQINARDKAGNAPLHAAAGFAAVSEDLLELLIAKGADVKARNEAGQTPLHCVSMIKRLDYPIERTAEVLLAHGAEVDANDQSGCTPLHFAVANGNKKLVDVLVAKGADVRTKAADGTTLLHQAVESEQLEMVEWSLSRGINVNSARSDGQTALHLAVEIGENSIVEALVARGADVKARDVRGNTPARLAIWSLHHLNRRSNHKDTVRLLLDKGAEISNIEIAAYLGDLPAVKGFLERASTVAAKDGALLSSLMIAALAGQKDVAAFLISQGASANAEVGQSGATALHYAAAEDSKDVAELLIANGANVNANGVKVSATQVGVTPLHFAARSGAMGVALLLIDHGADVNAEFENAGKWRPLDGAVEAGRSDMAKLLLQKGADTSRPDYLLHQACGQVDKDLAELLIRKGADVNYQLWNYGPAMAAMWSGYTNATKPADVPRLLGVLELLLDHGADPDGKDRWDWTLLHYACEEEGADLAKLLLDKGANANAAANDGLRPLHWAADKGRTAVVELLISRGANVNAKDYYGHTALSYAEDLGDNDIFGRPRKTPLTAEAIAGKKEVARILREHGAKE